MAQVVERRLGKAEVTGSNPVSSFIESLILSAFSFLKSKGKQEGNPAYV